MRANYVLAENGSWRLFYSHWAATTIHLDVIGGPEAATRFVAGQSEQPRDETGWLDDVWCEGAALIDHDRKQLLYFTIHRDYAVEQRAAHLALQRMWPGWQVRWAYDGLGDIVAHLGLDRAMVRAGEPEPGLVAAADEYMDCEYVLTIRDASGVTGYALDSGEEGTDLLDLGPDALRSLPPAAAAVSVDRLPNSGVHLDVVEQTAGFWTFRTLDGAFERARDRWPGWTWEFWESRYDEQLRRSDNAITWPDPDVKAALESLARQVESHATHDPLESARGFVARMEEVDTNVEVSSYFYAHANVPLIPTERAAVQAALAELSREVQSRRRS
jgi:hypothetical protein